jgi:hypothetical protein
MTTLEGRHVFLSASFPSGDRGLDVEPYDADAIADAVTAIVRAVLLSDGAILFGGHPTITPLVLLIGTELLTQNAVDIFQSRWFEDDVTPETIRLVESGLGEIHWMPKLATREASLEAMRSEMLAFGQLAAAVFVGGMSGIADEYDLVGRVHPEVLRLPLGGPGGAAARLLPSEDGLPTRLDGQLDSRHYPFLASLIVEVLAAAEDPPPDV